MGPEKVLLVVSVLWLFLPTKLRHPIHLSISIYISTKQRNRFTCRHTKVPPKVCRDRSPRSISCSSCGTQI